MHSFIYAVLGFVVGFMCASVLAILDDNEEERWANEKINRRLPKDIIIP